MLFLSCFCYVFVRALRSPAGKGLTSWLSFAMSNCEVATFPFVLQGQVWCLIVSISDIWRLSYFYKMALMSTKNIYLNS